ncbi:MAG: hypothetical protein Q4B59_04210 [Lachnospiraceae bacterium]|nr:hypothetical protein [Lachnospiraceae bacterium]
MNSFRNWFENFMVGRYGIDELSRFQMGLILVLLVVNLIFRVPLINTLVMLLILWSYFRIFSRNTAKRYAENAKYLQLKDKVTGKFSGTGAAGASAGRTMEDLKRNLADRKENHIYRCPKCSQKIRIPRGKGKIVITCPKCREEFVKRS